MKQAYNHKAAELSLQQGCLLWGPGSFGCCTQVMLVWKKPRWWPCPAFQTRPSLTWCRAVRCARNISRRRVMWRSPPGLSHRDLSPACTLILGAPPRATTSWWLSAPSQSGWRPVLSPCHQQMHPLRRCAQRLPDVIVSDNGPAFATAEYLAWLTKNG